MINKRDRERVHSPVHITVGRKFHTTDRTTEWSLAAMYQHMTIQ